jgi:hypothetical protein
MLAIAACGGKHRAPPDASPPVVLAAAPVPVDLGDPIFQNPLNLYDMMIPGAKRFDQVGTLDGTPITTTDIDQDAGGALTNLGNAIYQAREGGYRWLLESTALGRVDLHEEFARLPAPTPAELDAVDPDHALAVLPRDEQAAAKLTMWRLRAWEIRRSMLVADGLAKIPHGRLMVNITDARWANPEEIEATVDGVNLSRARMRALSGSGAELLRGEYYRMIASHVDTWVDHTLIEREAKRRGLAGSDAVVDAEVAALGPVRADEVRAYIAENPAYGKDPKGKERAAEQVRRLRRAQVERELPAKLRAAAKLVVDVQPPTAPALDLDVPAPRDYEMPRAPHTLVVFHAVGCPDCNLGSQLLLELMDAYEGRLTVIAGDSYRRGSLVEYRAALALHCADAQHGARGYLAQLVGVERPVEIGALAALATPANLDPAAFETCLRDDRYLVDIVENLGVAERLGLETDVPAFFVDGVRLHDLGDLDGVHAQIDSLIASVQK